MKTFNIFIISLGIAGALSMSSCSNFLKEDPYSYVGIDDVGNDDDAVNLWVTGVYSKWLDDMARWGNFPRLLDMDCDYVSGPDWAFSNLGAGNFQGDEVPNTLWNGCYNLINRANVAIERINKITGADETVKENGLGEVYFNKAFAYFLLVRAYGEIPLFDKSIDEGASYNQPRRSIKEAYDEYKEYAYLQTEFIEKHEEIRPGVFEITYSNGDVVRADYNRKTFSLKK